MNDKNVQIYFFVAVFLVVLAVNAAMFWPFVGAVVAALTLYTVFNPLYLKIKKVLGGRETLSSLAVVLLVLLIIIIPLVFFGTLVFKEISVLYGIFRDGGSESYISDLNRIINSQIQSVFPNVSVNIRSVFEKILDFFVDNITVVFSSVSGAFFSLFLSLMALYYLLKEGEKLKAVVTNLSPLADAYDQDVFTKLSRTVNSVIKGSILVAMIQGLLTGIGFLVFGVPNPAIWGAITVISALIPVVGTALVIVPGVIYLAGLGFTGAALGLLVWGAVVVGSVDNLLKPKLFERGISIHPFFILISVLGGLEFFGAVGFLLGPILLSLMFSLLDIYKKEFKKEVEN